MLVRRLQNSWKPVHQGSLDPWVVHLEALEHVQVLLPELEVLGQQAKRLGLVELPGSQKAQNEVIVGPEEADVWPGDNHVSDLLDVLVQRVRVLIQLQTGLLQAVRTQACLKVSHGSGSFHLSQFSLSVWD